MGQTQIAPSSTTVENKHLETFITTQDCHTFTYVISGLRRIRYLSVWLLLNLGGKSHDISWELGTHNRTLYGSSGDLGHGKLGRGYSFNSGSLSEVA